MLLRDGTPIDAVILSEENGWEYTFNNLPAHLDGDLSTLATYTVAEEAPEGYTSTITGNPADGFVITNTPTQPPAPEPEPEPEPEPSPNPEPSPDPTPEPSPQPEPGPAPKPSPQPGQPEHKPQQGGAGTKKNQSAKTLPQTGDNSFVIAGAATFTAAVAVAAGSVLVMKRRH